MSDLVERLREQLASDHIRGCMGRQYHCNCGYDIKTEGLLQTAADSIEALETGLREIKDQYLSPDQSSAIARKALAPEQDKP